jgi:hypothetical protein
LATPAHNNGVIAGVRSCRDQSSESTKSIMCQPSAHATLHDLHEAIHKRAASKKHNRFLAMLHLLSRVPFRREITTVTWSRRDSAKLKTILSRGLVGNATHLTTASPLESVGALSAVKLNLIHHRGLVSDAVFVTKLELASRPLFSPDDFKLAISQFC